LLTLVGLATLTMLDQYALIIGAMKAGTTTLFDHLARHPAIAPSVPKEPGYFAYDDQFARGEEWYHSIFDNSAGKARIGLNGSTDYTKFPHCPGAAPRIRAFGRNVKLIYILRNPLRRIESHARHVQRTQLEVRGINAPRSDYGLDHGVSPVSLDISRYAMQLEQYRDFYESGRLLITTLERMKQKPRETMSEIYAFLEIGDPPTDAEFAQKNKAKTYVSSDAPYSAWRFAKSISFLHKAYVSAVPASIRDKVRTLSARKKRIEGRFRLTPEEEQRILEILSGDLMRLRTEYGIDATTEWDLTGV